MLTAAAEHQAFLIFNGRAAGAHGVSGGQTPSLQAFEAEGRGGTGSTVIVCPGGGYQGLAHHEGEPVARWLNGLGITAFVLRYRVTPNYFPAPLADAQRAVRFVRHHAQAWGLDAGRIGMLGFSAGGHLVSTLATRGDAGNPEAADPLDRPASRLQAQLLIYPVITANIEPMQRSFINLLGENPSAEALAGVSNDRHVTAQTPPAFLFHSTADTGVPAAHSDAYAAALAKHGVAHAYVRGDYGGHGIGLQESWAPTAAKFLREQGF